MSWPRGDWFQLWTALAVTAGAVISFLLWLTGRRTSAIGDPAVEVHEITKRSGLCSFRFRIAQADAQKWEISKIRSGSHSAKLGRGAYTSDAGGGRELVKADTVHRAVRLSPPASEGELVVRSNAASVPIQFHMSPKANPRVTSRFTHHIKMHI